MSTSEKKSYSEMTNAELFNLAKSGQAKRTWSVGLFREISKRKYEPLNDDPNLKVEFETYHQEQMKKIQSTIESVLNKYVSDASRITKNSIYEGLVDKQKNAFNHLELEKYIEGLTFPKFPKLDLSNLVIPDVRLPSSIAPANAYKVNSEVVSIDDDINLDNVAVKVESELEFNASEHIALLEKLVQNTKIVVQNTKRDWFQWTTLGLFALSVLTSMVSLIISIIALNYQK